jgi:hypothetical protein
MKRNPGLFWFFSFQNTIFSSSWGTGNPKEGGNEEAATMAIP